jgi:hypothetical protein
MNFFFNLLEIDKNILFCPKCNLQN